MDKFKCVRINEKKKLHTPYPKQNRKYITAQDFCGSTSDVTSYKVERKIFTFNMQMDCLGSKDFYSLPICTPNHYISIL